MPTNVRVEWHGDAEPAMYHATDADGYGLYDDVGEPIYRYDYESEWHREYPMPGHHMRFLYAEGTVIVDNVVVSRDDYTIGSDGRRRATRAITDATNKTVVKEGAVLRGVLHGVVGLEHSYQFGPNPPFETVMSIRDWNTMVREHPETAALFRIVEETADPVRPPTHQYAMARDGRIVSGPPDLVGGRVPGAT